LDVYSTEEEQIEDVKKWFADNGKSIVFGIVFGFGAIFGWRAWQKHEIEQASVASGIYQSLVTATSENMNDDADKFAMQLIVDYPDTAYAVFADLMMAKNAIVNNDPEKAVIHLRQALEKNKQESLEHIIRLRLAKVLTSSEKYQEGLTLLNQTDKGTFSADYDGLRGDILKKQGDIEGARAAYEQALTKTRANGENTAILEMKLDDIGRS